MRTRVDDRRPLQAKGAGLSEVQRRAPVGGGSDTTLLRAWQESPLRTLPASQRDVLIRSGRVAHISAGKTIYGLHDPIQVVLVLDGVARVKAVAPDGRAATIRLGGSGQLFGIPGLLGGRPVVTVDAVTDLQYWAFDTEVFRRALQESAQLGYLIACHLARSTEETVELFAVNVFGSIRRRVAHQLLDLAESDNGRFLVHVSQDEIASSIGSVREVVARAIRSLKGDGIVARTSSGLEISDVAALHRIASDPD
ncbi:Crp/Fnr family transcriptional regulator [Mycolicibacterium palauense]|uniref:Crp/Fnr family transcriptional regulator n=1 Tax=Mycolicibacterium palauense TaxID=2034511 RepID=UPI000BFEF3CB|nr:Crp/Fnr family transcriptional regulator [Mycolicibacterium palauense]